MASNTLHLAVISSMGLGLAALFQAAPANALVQTKPAIPFATFGNNNPEVSSNGSSSQLTFQKFNASNAILRRVTFNFTGPTAGSAPGGVISGTYTFGQALGQPNITNNATVSASNISAQVQLFFSGDTLQLNGPTIAVTPGSSSFVKTNTINTKTETITAGSYSGSATSTDTSILALFNGAGTVTTSKFQSIWNSSLTCTNPNGTSCLTRAGIGFNAQVGEQIDPDNAPSSLVGGGNAWVTVSYDYDPINAAATPGPLPILGAAAAFGASRKIRNRIKLANV
jgi:hypothetical protein